MTVSNPLYFQIHLTGGRIQDIELEPKDAVVVGRRSITGSQICDLFIDDPYISRRHCKLFLNPENPQQWMLEDLGSNNGTKLDSVAVVDATEYGLDSWIQVGTTRIFMSLTPTSQHPYAAGADNNTFQADATIVRPAIVSGEDATMMQPRGEETIVQPRGEETIVQPRSVSSEGLTAIHQPQPPTEGGGSADATIVRPSLSKDEHTTTVHAPAGADATIIHDRHAENAPASQPKKPTQIRPGTEVAQDAAQDAAQDDRHDQSIQAALQSGLARDLVNSNYLDVGLASQLLVMAQNNGLTFFRNLVQTPEVHFIKEIFNHVSNQYGWSYIQDEEHLSKEVVDVSWLTYNHAYEIGCVALKKASQDGRLRYATVDPFDLTMHDWVERCSRSQAERVMVDPAVFFQTMRRLRESPTGDSNEVGISIDFTQKKEESIREQVGGVDVPQMVNYFFFRANTQGASDIHIEPTETQLMVRNRVDGILHQEISLPIEFHPETVSRLKILSNMDVAEKRRPQDGRLAVVIRSNPIDVRVSSYPTVFGEKFVLRLLDKNALRPSVETLGLMDRDRRLLKEKLQAPYGLIMISGPTGSGKTTTLYSCLGSLDKTSKNILTVEDPVEYRMDGVHQMQVNNKIGLTFASGLRTILRQDPDVIMVGETRDNETAAMAVQAALTGHIVFSTIHTNDAAGVITRLLDMDIEPFLVATALSLAVAQRLVRTICSQCKISVLGKKILAKLHKDGVTQERLDFLDIDIDPNLEYTQGRGCSNCRNTGYHGRQAVFELFEMTEEARKLIMSGSPDAGSLKNLAKQKGMTTLISHGVQLVDEEVTTFEEILRVLGEEA